MLKEIILNSIEGKYFIVDYRGKEYKIKWTAKMRKDIISNIDSFSTHYLQSILETEYRDLIGTKSFFYVKKAFYNTRVKKYEIVYSTVNNSTIGNFFNICDNEPIINYILLLSKLLILPNEKLYLEEVFLMKLFFDTHYYNINNIVFNMYLDNENE